MPPDFKTKTCPHCVGSTKQHCFTVVSCYRIIQGEWNHLKIEEVTAQKQGQKSLYAYNHQLITSSSNGVN